MRSVIFFGRDVKHVMDPVSLIKRFAAFYDIKSFGVLDCWLEKEAFLRCYFKHFY